eukprot:766497-Hanusia_phi.AAC.3
MDYLYPRIGLWPSTGQRTHPKLFITPVYIDIITRLFLIYTGTSTFLNPVPVVCHEVQYSLLLTPLYPPPIPHNPVLRRLRPGLRVPLAPPSGPTTHPLKPIFISAHPWPPSPKLSPCWWLVHAQQGARTRAGEERIRSTERGRTGEDPRSMGTMDESASV